MAVRRTTSLVFVQVNRKKSMAEYLPAFLLTSPRNLLKLRMESRYRES